MRVLKLELRRRGWRYDVVSGRPGYDLRVREPHRGWKRVEVKSGTKDGWLHIDVRKALKTRWNSGSNAQDPLVRGLGDRPSVKVTFDLDSLTFDEVFVVTRIGSAKPIVYRLRRKQVLTLPATRLSYRGFLTFRLGPSGQRERYQWSPR